MAERTTSDARELDRRLLHLELVVSRLAEQVKQLMEDVNALGTQALRDAATRAGPYGL